MASESSSAVLEMNDADTEDTEATTVTDDAHEGTPLIMEHGCDIAVKVDAPMKQLSTLETYVTYRVRCVCARWPTPAFVRRRYNHFKVLHKRLVACHPWVAPPPLPPLHSARQQLDRYSSSFVAIRTLAIDAFLDRVAKHPILTHSEDFRLFLTTPDEEFEKVFKNESSALNLWGLSTAFYGSSETKTANGPRVKDPEFTSVSDYLQSLEQKLTTLCALTTKLHKGTVGLSTELISMKRVCDAWATQAGGRLAGAAGAVARGAGAAGGAAGRVRAPLAPRARLPLLAAYAHAHRAKIAARDQLHAAYVSGSNTTDDVHNRVSQASEAIRSELSDWLPKTRSEIKSLLVQIAERQLNLHTQTLYGWEHALKLATEQNISQIFKTVSKNAVQNLSPSRCRSEMTFTETADIESDYDDDSKVDFDDKGTDDDQFVNVDVEDDETADFVGITTDFVNKQDDLNDKDSNVNDENIDFVDKKSIFNDEKADFVDNTDDDNVVNADFDVKHDISNDKTDTSINQDNACLNDNNRNADDLRTDDRQASFVNSKDYKVNYDEEVNHFEVLLNEDVGNTKVNVNNILSTDNNDLNSEIVTNITANLKPNDLRSCSVNKVKEGTEVLEASSRERAVITEDNAEVISDPLRGFSDVDLS